MDFIIELIGEIFLEGCMEIIQNKKITKWIRYPLAIIMMLLYVIIMLWLVYIALILWKKNVFVGILIIIVVIIFLTGMIGYFYKKKKQ